MRMDMEGALMGAACAGQVIAIGINVANCKIGDWVAALVHDSN